MKRQKVDEAGPGKYMTNKDKRDEIKQDFYKF
jgi:hypothetical protein